MTICLQNQIASPVLTFRRFLNILKMFETVKKYIRRVKNVLSSQPYAEYICAISFSLYHYLEYLKALYLPMWISMGVF